MKPMKSQLRLDTALGPYPVSDELPPPANYLAMITFLLTRHPDPLQHPFGQQMGQLTAVSTVGLDPVAIFLRDQARRSNETGDPVVHQAVMKPEPKISGFVDRLQGVAVIASQILAAMLPRSLECWR